MLCEMNCPLPGRLFKSAPHFLYHSSVDCLSIVWNGFRFYSSANTDLPLSVLCKHHTQYLNIFSINRYLIHFKSASSDKSANRISNRAAASRGCSLARSQMALSEDRAASLREALIWSNFVFDKLLVYWPHTDKALPVQLGPVSSVHKWDCEKVRLVFTKVLM